MKRHKTRRKTLTIPSKNTKQNKSQDKHHTKPKKMRKKKVDHLLLIELWKRGEDESLGKAEGKEGSDASTIVASLFANTL